MKYIKELDSLRAFAAVFVFISHFGPNGGENGFLKILFTQLIPDGRFGVDLFFVLSGFLITGVLLQAQQHATVSRFYVLKNFVIRRSLRLFPAYFLLLAILYAFNYPDVRSHVGFFATYTANFLSLFTHSWNWFSHTWTLAVEEQFYLIWPWVILFTPRRYFLHTVLFFIQLGVVSSVLTGYELSPFFNRHFGDFVHVFTFNCFHAFAIGALLSLSQQDERLKRTVPRVFAYLLPAFLLLYAVKCLQPQLHIDLAFLNRLTNAVLSVNLIAYVVNGKYPKPVAWVLRNRAAMALGRVSYGFYLYHYVLGMLFVYRLHPRYFKSGFFSNQYAFAALLFAVVVAVSFASYYAVEMPFLKLKKYVRLVPEEREVDKSGLRPRTAG